MRRAIELGAQAMRTGQGGPFGAVVVRDGRIVGEGANQVLMLTDPTAHAEMQAIRAASTALASYHLDGCEIFTSCEPCPMCLSAIYWARLDRIWYANGREDAAAAGFSDAELYAEVARPISARAIPAGRLLADEAAAVFAEWRGKADRIVY